MSFKRFVHHRVLVALSAIAIISLAAPSAALACRAAVGNFVWEDLNGNGVQDAGEPGIPSVPVEVYYNGALHDTGQTDAGGFYAFTEGTASDAVCDGTIVVRLSTPAGFTTTLIGQGGDPATDSNDPAGAPAALDPVTGEDNTLDFGFVRLDRCESSIGNFVWNDANGNGIQDAGEVGLPGTAVTLSGGATNTTSTGSGGVYLFGGLCAGTYQVCAVTPLGAQASPADALISGVNDDAVDSDGRLVLNNSCVSVTLGRNETNTTIDFGFYATPVISPGTGTPGYWKNHPEAWPVDAITIGGVVYTKSSALYWLGQPDGDKTHTMFRGLVSAKLNVLIGNESSCIASTISAADVWMTTYPVGSNVRARTAAWSTGEPLYRELDAYNNGDRCAPHRD